MRNHKAAAAASPIPLTSTFSSLFRTITQGDSNAFDRDADVHFGSGSALDEFARRLCFLPSSLISQP